MLARNPCNTFSVGTLVVLSIRPIRHPDRSVVAEGLQFCYRAQRMYRRRIALGPFLHQQLQVPPLRYAPVMQGVT